MNGCVTLLSLHLLLGASSKVAVLDLNTTGVEPNEGKALNTMLVGVLTQEVAALGHEVISSADIAAMLSYERLKDLVGCNDTTCLAEIGGALGSDIILNGSLAKVGGSFTLSLRLVNIKTTEVMKRFQGSAGDPELLASTAKRGVGILFGATVDLSGTGTLYIKTIPSGASISLDGKPVGNSPITLDDVPAGEHRIQATGQGLRGEEAILLRANDIARLTIEMKNASPVQLKILSTPGDCTVILDGDVVGVTPLLLQEVQPGRHDLRIETDGHMPHEETLALSLEEYEEGGRVPFKVDAKLTERFTLLSVPVGASLGTMLDASDASAGVTASGELFIELGAGFEYALGFVSPFAITNNLRFWAIRGDHYEIGLLARVALYDEMPRGGLSLAPSGGLSMAALWPGQWGVLGLRADTSMSYPLGFRRPDGLGMTFPISLAFFWRAG